MQLGMLLAQPGPACCLARNGHPCGLQALAISTCTFSRQGSSTGAAWKKVWCSWGIAFSTIQTAFEGLQAVQTMPAWPGVMTTPCQTHCLLQAGVHIWVVSPLWVERSAAEQRRAMVRLRQPSCCLPLQSLPLRFSPSTAAGHVKQCAPRLQVIRICCLLAALWARSAP